MAFWQDSNRLLIDGELVTASAGRTFPSIDPATEAIVGESADATVADAVRVANNSKYGLSGGVLAEDEERAVAVAKRMRTGTVSVYGGMWHAPDAPFGGYKQSGIGRENGTAGLEEFLQTKLLARPAAV